MKLSAYESGLSDFHKLTTTLLRKSITTGNQLTSINTVDYSQFQEIFLKILDTIAPIKKKILHFNQSFHEQSTP